MHGEDYVEYCPLGRSDDGCTRAPVANVERLAGPTDIAGRFYVVVRDTGSGAHYVVHGPVR